MTSIGLSQTGETSQYSDSKWSPCQRRCQGRRCRLPNTESETERGLQLKGCCNCKRITVTCRQQDVRGILSWLVGERQRGFVSELAIAGSLTDDFCNRIINKRLWLFQINYIIVAHGWCILSILMWPVDCLQTIFRWIHRLSSKHNFQS